MMETITIDVNNSKEINPTNLIKHIERLHKIIHWIEREPGLQIYTKQLNNAGNGIIVRLREYMKYGSPYYPEDLRVEADTFVEAIDEAMKLREKYDKTHSKE